MAYYDALIAKWGTLAGTTAQKLTAINALLVPQGSPNPAILTPSQIINACVPADIASLTTAQITLFALLLQGSTVDASIGTTVRAGIVAIFSGKTTTISQLSALVAPFDNPTIPWWQSVGYPRAVDSGDVSAAGLS